MKTRCSIQSARRALLRAHGSRYRWFSPPSASPFAIRIRLSLVSRGSSKPEGEAERGRGGVIGTVNRGSGCVCVSLPFGAPVQRAGTSRGSMGAMGTHQTVCSALSNSRICPIPAQTPAT